ncbi:MAG: S1 family peptidase [Peptococcaceae bacterium]|nr:S1 family peptidase [Peptococcaceae bacterium]
MERCMRALKRTRHFFLGKKNVVGVGVGMKKVGLERTEQPSIIVFVEKKWKEEDLPREHIIPKKISGVHIDVVETGRIRLLDNRTGRHRPARPGMSIGHYKITAGTFGVVVKDKKTGEPLILSNNHVLANATDGRDDRAALGDPVFQPGVYDGGKNQDKIAELLRFVPLLRSVKEADCPVAAGAARVGSMLVHVLKPDYELRFVKHYRGSNMVDAAVARPVSPDVIARDIMEIGIPRGTGTVEVGQAVMKSGRSSGVTSGQVSAVDVLLQVDLNDSETAMFSDQIVADMVSRGGDSGSLVLDERKRAVGLLFAGSEKVTVFNRLSNVFEKLAVDLY